MVQIDGHLSRLVGTTEPVGPCCLLADKPVTEPWRAEVTTADVGGNRWSTNALRFGDKEAAIEYAANLARRWMLVTRWRAVDATVPLSQHYEPESEEGSW